MRVFRNILEILYNLTLLKHCDRIMSLRFGITLPSYHRVCFNSDDIDSKSRVITTRPGHVNGVVKTPLSFGR